MDKEESQPATEMHERILIVQNELGVHARPAAMIVRLANKYNADVNVEKEDEHVNGKSIMGIMMLAASQNSKLRFTATGVDAEKVLQKIEELFNRKFEES